MYSSLPLLLTLSYLPSRITTQRGTAVLAPIKQVPPTPHFYVNSSVCWCIEMVRDAGDC